MKLTVSLIKADIGGVGGHYESSEKGRLSIVGNTSYTKKAVDR